MNFKIGQGYNRRNDLHENYGGQHQSGISTPSNHPLIYFFFHTLQEKILAIRIVLMKVK